MRDIRPDLKERLAALSAERENLKSELTLLDHREAGLRALLLEEERRWEKVQPTLFKNGHAAATAAENETPVGQTPLARFLVETLGDRRPHSLKDLVLRAIQENFDFGTKNAGRSIHFALIGLRQNGYVRRLQTGEWEWTGGENQTAQRS